MNDEIDDRSEHSGIDSDGTDFAAQLRKRRKQVLDKNDDDTEASINKSDDFADALRKHRELLVDTWEDSCSPNTVESGPNNNTVENENGSNEAQTNESVIFSTISPKNCANINGQTLDLTSDNGVDISDTYESNIQDSLVTKGAQTHISCEDTMLAGEKESNSVKAEQTQSNIESPILEDTKTCIENQSLHSCEKLTEKEIHDNEEDHDDNINIGSQVMDNFSDVDSLQQNSGTISSESVIDDQKDAIDSDYLNGTPQRKNTDDDDEEKFACKSVNDNSLDGCDELVGASAPQVQSDEYNNEEEYFAEKDQNLNDGQSDNGGVRDSTVTELTQDKPITRKEKKEEEDDDDYQDADNSESSDSDFGDFIEYNESDDDDFGDFETSVKHGGEDEKSSHCFDKEAQSSQSKQLWDPTFDNDDDNSSVDNNVSGVSDSFTPIAPVGRISDKARNIFSKMQARYTFLDFRHDGSIDCSESTSEVTVDEFLSSSKKTRKSDRVHLKQYRLNQIPKGILIREQYPSLIINDDGEGPFHCFKYPLGGFHPPKKDIGNEKQRRNSSVGVEVPDILPIQLPTGKEMPLEAASPVTGYTRNIVAMSSNEITPLPDIDIDTSTEIIQKLKSRIPDLSFMLESELKLPKRVEE